MSKTTIAVIVGYILLAAGLAGGIVLPTRCLAFGLPPQMTWEVIATIGVGGCGLAIMGSFILVLWAMDMK